MAQGIIQRLQGEFTDDSLPRFYPASPILNKGSLLYVAPANPLSGITTFPVNGAVVRNLAWDIAQKILGGSGVASELDLQGTLTNTLDPTKSFAEVTPKKALNVIISQVGDVNIGNDFMIALPQKIRTHIFTSGHDFYVDMIQNRTRIANGASADFWIMQNTSNYAFYFGHADVAPNSTITANHIGAINGLNQNVIGPQFRAVGFRGFRGTIPTDNTLATFRFKIGSTGPFSNTETNAAPSLALYEIYIEDLTVSGRTFAEAGAFRQTYYTTAFAPGGIYNGDTLTAVSTMP